MESVAPPTAEIEQPLFSAPLENESATILGTPPETGLVEKLKQKGKSLFEKHGVIFKRGGGRPRKDGLPNKLDVPLNAPASALPAAVAAPASDGSPVFDAALVRRCVSAVSKGLLGFLDKMLFRKATIVAKLSGEQAQAIVKDAAITESELSSFSELAEICLRKYGVGTQYMPEFGLGSICLGVGLRYAAAFRALEPAPQAEEKKP